MKNVDSQTIKVLNKLNIFYNDIFLMTLKKKKFYFLLLFLSLFFNYFEYDEAYFYFITNNIYINGSENDFHNFPLSTVAGKSFLWSLKSLSVINSYFPEIFFLNRLYSFFCITLSFLLVLIILEKNFNYCSRFFFLSYFLFIFWFCFHAGGMTSRYDAQVAFLCVFFIFSIFEYDNNKAYFVISTIINFILILYHPNIIPLIFINFFLFIFFYLRKKKNYFIF